MAKLGGGLAATGGVVGVGVVYKDKIFDWFSFSDVRTYWVQKTSAAPSDNALSELYVNDQKKFECQMTGSESADNLCEIFLIKDDMTKRIITRSEIDAAKTKVTEKAKLKQNAAYKLTIDVKKFKDFDETKNIEIKNIEKTNGTQKVYATLKIIQRIDQILENKKSNKILGKATSSQTTASSGTFNEYKCRFGEAATDKEYSCEIWKFDNDIDAEANLDYSKSVKSTSLDDLKSKDGKFFTIVFKEEDMSQITEADLKKTIIFAKTTNTNSTPTVTKMSGFTFESLLFGKLSSTKADNYAVLTTAKAAS